MLLLYDPLLTKAQPNVHDAPMLSDSAKGYWRLHTDYDSRLTRVSFYSLQDQLLYQETIKDRYVKLTKRTMAEFDDLLARLVEGHLVTDRIKSYDLPPIGQEAPSPPFSLPASKEQLAESSQAGSDQLAVELIQIEDKKVRLWYKNLAQQPLLIRIQDEVSQNMYRATHTAETNSKVFNLSGLPAGHYRFKIDCGQTIVQYSLVIAGDEGRIKLNRLATPSDRSNH
ncbi:hypothetical protein M0L20_29815 [Spirosoma sp. RP8]|uniref:Uncharacterized protein n=1 Tax=Spirosoma liriopis TaxID=2937440 RepID=A0ABT0HV78_9BACT|nr:hypothetical protein [Spirosoma liriopis]MCK8496101.1 hypothetical protein [Spirosoma liriopis]